MSRSKAAPSRKSRSNASEAAWTLAVGWLAARDHSTAEIQRRLEASGASVAVITATLCRLRELRYLDDARFVANFVDRALRLGHGSERVRAELEGRGVDRALADPVIEGAYINEQELAEAALKRHRMKPPSDAKERARTARFLLNRGFPEAVVLAIIGEDC